MAVSAPRFEPAVAAALLSAGAAAIHASAAGPHFAEHLLIGGLFVVTALAQAAWAALVLTSPSWPLLAAGVVGNAGVVAAWALSRTVGLPFGPESWVPEPVAALDLAATSFEIGIVAVGVLLLAAGGPYAAGSTSRAAKRFATVGAIALAAVTSAAYAGTPNGGHHHHAAAERAAPATHHQAAPAAKRTTVVPRRASRPAAARARAKRRAATHAHAHAHATPHSH